MSAATPILKPMRLRSKTAEFQGCGERTRRSARRTSNQQQRKRAVKSSSESTAQLNITVDSCSPRHVSRKFGRTLPNEHPHATRRRDGDNWSALQSCPTWNASQSKNSTSRNSESPKRTTVQIEKCVLSTPVQIKSHLSPSVYMRNAQCENFSRSDDAIFVEIVLIKAQG